MAKNSKKSSIDCFKSWLGTFKDNKFINSPRKFKVKCNFK